ncbi:PREDICTED: putative FBD-associated F-box protein At5g56430 [Camelina sativa]|uniref:FBD-associated F-box protein At5g56430 n=1 Tax=Camelina sativa TaxID=90675 RepID=A0ABM1QNS0_CAMSA|nr:PREDICTED: putative FBD-associated F-box protein At5g56430 [Camelina sativa]
MRNINDLPNDLLVKILSSVPTKVAVSTCLLSKRWGSVWKLISKLDYDDSLSDAPSGFIGKFETLVVLGLRKVSIDNVPPTTRFRSLKTLSLLDVWFSSDETVTRLLSCCPILETLIVHRWGRDKVKTFAICVPSLKSLTIRHRVGGYHEPRDDNGFVINAPSLKYLNIVDHFSGFYSLVDMPEQLKADIHIRHCDSEKLLGCLTSSKNLSLCLKPLEGAYPHGDFDQLVSLDLCVLCSLDWLNLILRRSPKLRALRLYQAREVHWSCRNSKSVRTKWEQPIASFVPECLLLSLRTVKWFMYKGTEEEKSVVMYLLKNGDSLETMSINFSESITLEERNQMNMELESMPRRSNRCQLSFT